MIRFYWHMKFSAWIAVLLLSTFSVSAQGLTSGNLPGFSKLTNSLVSFESNLRPSELSFSEREVDDNYTTIRLGSSYSDIYRTAGLEQPGASYARSVDLQTIHGRNTSSIRWEFTTNLRTTSFHGDISPDEYGKYVAMTP